MDLDRDDVVRAVREVLDGDKGQCRPEHARIGALVADRLGLLEDTAPEIPSAKRGTLDALGVGVFVRRIKDWPIEVLARFDWACVAVVNDGRGKINRDSQWWRDARAAGVTLTAMDWLPTPGKWRSGLDDAIAWSTEHGSICYVADAEGPAPPRGWNGAAAQAREYVAAARALCDRHGCALGWTGLALPPRDDAWRAFAGGSDLTICQPYDRDHELDPRYPVRSVERYRELGAQRVVLGRGAFRRERQSDGSLASRWRTPSEIEAHRATTPAGTVSEAWWMPAGTPRARIVDAIVRR
jgi:hypothetical protein